MERFHLIRLLASRYLVETFLQVASAELHRSKQKTEMMAIENLVAIGFKIKPVISPTYSNFERALKSCDSAIKFRIINENTIDNFGNFRRSTKVRRKTSPRKFFFEGGFERRSWKEHRKIGI